MIVGIMQPYFFPYIGYWQLIQAVDTFVIYDDVHYIKQGYINRNSILMNHQKQMITLQLAGASSNKLINEINVGNNSYKLLKSIIQNYKKAPESKNSLPLIQSILESSEKNLSKFLGDSIQAIASYFKIDTKIIYSSDINKNNSLKGQERVIDICLQLKATRYINPIGGQSLYRKEDFFKKNIILEYLEPNLVKYKQFNDNFIPSLSLIDVCMFNNIERVKRLLNEYELK